MANSPQTAKIDKQSSMQESPVKHTPDSEIPDTSSKAMLFRRAKNAAIVYSNEINFKYVAYGFLAVFSFGMGRYFMKRR